MFRSLIYLVALVALTIWSGGTIIIAGLVRHKYRPGGLYDWATRIYANGLLKASGVKVSTVGFENLPDGPAVFVANHQSFFDILALISVLVGRVRFVAKKELAKIPVFGQALRAAGHIFIDRQRRQAAFESYEIAAEMIRAGMSAVIFAEGTRSRTGDLLPFKKGPFVLALASQVPVVPVYCAHTFGILPKGSVRIHPHPITLYFGDPIPTEGMDYEDRGELLKRTESVVKEFAAQVKSESKQDESLS